MGHKHTTRYTMNTFHLASLALLVGLISAIPTSTYPHVDAVVPEIEFPAVEDEPKYVTTTFTIQPSKKKEFLTWIAAIAEKSYTCEEGTDVYKVYEGDWQVGVAPNVANTYTIFGKFSNPAAFDYHNLNGLSVAKKNEEPGGYSGLYVAKRKSPIFRGNNRCFEKPWPLCR